MSDEETKAAEAAEVKQAEQETQKKTLEGKSSDELIDIIRETRNEAKNRRLKEKELADKITELEAKVTQTDQDKLLAEGKKDELIETLKTQLKSKDDEYKPFKEKASKYDEYDAAKRTKIKEILSDDWMPSFDNLPLIELEELASKLNSNVKLKDSDNGTNKAKPGKEYFTLEELKRLTPKELADKDVLAKANKSMEFHSKK